MSYDAAACEGKQAFATPAMAYQIVQDHNKKPKGHHHGRSRRHAISPIMAYRCQVCGLWHVGASSPTIGDAKGFR